MADARSPVYEEALLQELAYAIAHIAHAEQHLLEIDSQIAEPSLSTYIDRLRMGRKTLGEVLFGLVGVMKGGEGAESRTAAESFWCTVKHLSMAVVHCDECAEKVIRRLSEKLSTGDAVSAKSLLEDLSKIYSVRRDAFKMLIDILKGGDLKDLQVESARCREDLCVE
ncbi:hypothetical protein [Infirmifilum uzonense]|nr:hypothetical protein [Infirmifilum uzonense]